MSQDELNQSKCKGTSYAVSTWIPVAQGVVVHIRIPIQRLWIPCLRHHRIRADETPQPRVVVVGVVVHQAESGLGALAGPCPEGV